MSRIYEPTDEYIPIEAGSIDGTDSIPHDHAILRATKFNYDPKKDNKIKGRKECTLFIGRLNLITTERDLEAYFEKFGKIYYIRIVKDVITELSRGYAFIEFKHSADCRKAYNSSRRVVIDGCRLIVDYERERQMKNWVPRRFGGGLGGKKESGQLRFGGPDRPHKLPFSQSNNIARNQREYSSKSRK